MAEALLNAVSDFDDIKEHDESLELFNVYHEEGIFILCRGSD